MSPTFPTDGSPPDPRENARLGAVVVLALVATGLAIAKYAVPKGPFCGDDVVSRALTPPGSSVELLGRPSPLGLSARLHRCGVRARYHGREGDLIFSFRERGQGVSVVLEGFDGAVLPPGSH